MAAKADSLHPVQSVSSPATAYSILGRTPGVPDGAVISKEDVTFYITEAEVIPTQNMASELHGSASYRDDFGKGAPEPMQLAARMLSALAHQAELDRAEAWLNYVKAQTHIRWDAALTDVSRLRKLYAAHVEAEPNIAHRYAKMAAYFQVRDGVAARGAETRRRNRDAKKNTPSK